MNRAPTLPESDGWTALAEDWQAERPAVGIDLEALRRRVAAAGRRMIWQLIASIVVSLVYIAISAFQLIRDPGPDSTFFALDSLTLLVLAWGFSIWASWGAWKPLAETTEMFLALERRRLVAHLRAANAAIGLVLIQLAIVLAWARWRPPVVAREALPRVLLLLPAAIVVTVIVVAVRAHRRVPPRLAEVDRLLAELRPEEPA
jgi:hypothetical protein